jgi:signal transduction histidine kinase
VKRRWPQRILRSVFTKLLVIIVLTGLMIHVAFGAFIWKHRKATGGPFKNTISHYLSYIISDLGQPPDRVRAVEIARNTAMIISFQGKQTSWSTHPDLARPMPRRFHNWPDSPNFRTAMDHRHFFVELTRGEGRYLFEFSTYPGDGPELRALRIGLLVAVSLILIGAYLAIRSVLKPIDSLKTGVQQVSAGNLKHRVDVKRKDEFRDLAEAFNDMTARIRSMLQTKERLLLDVSHELRSPLTRVNVALEFLGDGQAKDSIKADVDEMDQMIGAILETARAHHAYSELNLEPVDLSSLLSEILTELEHQAPGVDCRDLPRSLPCRADSDKLKSVIRNVLTNALKYSDNQPRPVAVSVTASKEYGIIRIQDHGVGIPTDELEFIFEPFYRVDKSRSRQTGGFGLGLSICKAIMDAHGGKIEIASSPDIGTVVSLHVPLIPPS